MSLRLGVVRSRHGVMLCVGHTRGMGHVMRDRQRIGVTLAVACASMLLLAGCAGAQPTGGETSPQSSEGSKQNGSTAPTSEATASGETDCVAVGDAIVAWFEASFAAASTEVTNGEVAAQFAAAADAHAAVSPPPDAPAWENLGAVLDEYVSEWSALPADEGALGNAETVEANVDEFASSIGFDNDDFDDYTPIVGETCNAELEATFEG
jgi:hypothetical protein